MRPGKRLASARGKARGLGAATRRRPCCSRRGLAPPRPHGACAARHRPVPARPSAAPAGEGRRGGAMLRAAPVPGARAAPGGALGRPDGACCGSATRTTRSRTVRTCGPRFWLPPGRKRERAAPPRRNGGAGMRRRGSGFFARRGLSPRRAVSLARRKRRAGFARGMHLHVCNAIRRCICRLALPLLLFLLALSLSRSSITPWMSFSSCDLSPRARLSLGMCVRARVMLYRCAHALGSATGYRKSSNN